MQLLLLLIFWISAATVFGESDNLPKPGPTAFEKFVKHRHTQFLEVQETARFGNSNEWLKVIALVARNHQTHPSEMRGVWFAVSSLEATDNVYLNLARAHALRARLVSLQEDSKYLRERGEGLTTMGTADCAPSQARYRIHELCVGNFQRHQESGLSLSTGPKVSLLLKDVKLIELIDSIDSALDALEHD